MPIQTQVVVCNGLVAMHNNGMFGPRNGRNFTNCDFFRLVRYSIHNEISCVDLVQLSKRHFLGSFCFFFDALPLVFYHETGRTPDVLTVQN